MKSWFGSLRNLVLGNQLGSPLAAELRTKWNSVQRFYGQVQACDNEAQLAKYAAQMPEIDHYMNQIVDLLLQERPAAGNAARGIPPADSPGSPASSADSRPSELPPCYELLLGVTSAGISASFSALSMTGSMKTGSAPSVEAQQLATCDIIVRSCQYAKHDQPKGTRKVMLRFLSRVFGEADLPFPQHSLLQYGEEVAKPTLDMIAKIDSSLDPRKSNSRAAGASLKATISRAAYTVSVTEDHLAFVELLAVLAAKVEETPSLFAFFLPNPLRPATTTPTDTQHCILVEYLLPYVGALPETALPAAQQLQLTEVALAGMLSLIKCCDVDARRTMLAECARIGPTVFADLRRAMLTICTLPPDETSAALLQICVAMLKFLDAVTALAPQMALQMNLSAEVASLLHDSCIKFFDSAEERTFIASAIVMDTVVRSLSSEELLSVVGDLIFVPSGLPQGKAASKPSPPSTPAEVSLTTSPTQKDPTAPNVFERALVTRINDINPNVAIASLTLVNTMITRIPSHVLRYEFGMKQGASDAQTSVPTEFFANVKDLFAPRILCDGPLCGTDKACVVDEVTRKYLAMEAMLAAEDWSSYRESFSYCPARAKGAGAAEGEGEGAAIHGDPAGTLLQSLVPKYDISEAAVSSSSLVTKLTQRLGDALEAPFNLSALVTQALLSVALLPHPMIIVHLLSGGRSGSKLGALSATLIRLSSRIESILDRDERAAEETKEPIPQAAAAPQPLSATSSTAFTKLTLFKRVVERPFHDAGAIEGDDTFSVAMRNSKSFIDGCVLLEAFRRELESCLCMHEVSRALSQLHASDTERKH